VRTGEGTRKAEGSRSWVEDGGLDPGLRCLSGRGSGAARQTRRKNKLIAVIDVQERTANKSFSLCFARSGFVSLAYADFIVF
jgi:hypothetical protein